MQEYPFIGWNQTSKGDYSVSTPKFENYPLNIRWPLPCAIITVPSKQDADSIKRLEQQIKDELNVKQLIIRVGTNGECETSDVYSLA